MDIFSHFKKYRNGSLTPCASYGEYSGSYSKKSDSKSRLKRNSLHGKKGNHYQKRTKGLVNQNVCASNWEFVMKVEEFFSNLISLFLVHVSDLPATFRKLSAAWYTFYCTTMPVAYAKMADFGKLMWNYGNSAVDSVYYLLAIMVLSFHHCVNYSREKVKKFYKRWKKIEDKPQPESPKAKESNKAPENFPSTADEAVKHLLAMQSVNAYSVLNVQIQASDDEIKRNFRKLAVLVHPDKTAHPRADEAFKILVQAFERIGEPEKRQTYDNEVMNLVPIDNEIIEMLNKMKEELQKTEELFSCSNCKKTHKCSKTDRTLKRARFCDSCQIWHSAKEGDLWAEGGTLGFHYEYYAVVHGCIRDVTKWVSCMGGVLSNIPANSHDIHMKFSVGKKKDDGSSNGVEMKVMETFLDTLLKHTKLNSEQKQTVEELLLHIQKTKRNRKTSDSSTSSYKKAKKRKK